MGEFFPAIGIVLGDRSARRFIVRPLILAFLTWFTLLLIGFALVVPMFAGAAEARGFNSELAFWSSSLIFGFLWLLVSGPVYLALAIVTSGFYWEGLSAHVERTRFARTHSAKHSLPNLGFRLALRIMFAFAMAVTALLCGLLGCAPLAVVPAALAAIAECSDPVFTRRGVLFPEQMGQALRTPGVVSLGFLAGVTAFIPLLNVLLMPVYVVATTILVAKRESA